MWLCATLRACLIASPFASLWTSAKEGVSEDGGGWSRFLKQKMLENPPTPEDPWTLILYTDEVTPGNVLAVVNNRKIQAIYFSFLELGANALSREEAWFVLMIEFSSTVNQMHAGIPQVVSKCIGAFFQRDGWRS